MTREEQLQRESEVYAWTANQFDIQLAFKKGAEWEHKRLIEKACDWLVVNAEDSAESALYLVAKFKRAMEE